MRLLTSVLLVGNLSARYTFKRNLRPANDKSTMKSDKELTSSKSITNHHLHKGLFLLNLTITNQMASTRHSNNTKCFFSFLALLLLSDAQWVTSNGRGEIGFSPGDGTWHYSPANDSFSNSRTRKENNIKNLTSPRFDYVDESIVSAELLQQWKLLYTTIREEERVVQNLFREATNAQFKAGTQLRSAELKKDQVDPVQLAALQSAFDKSVDDLKKANQQQKEIKKLVEKSRKINAKPGNITEKKVDGMRTVYNEYLAKYHPGQPPLKSPVVSKSANESPALPPATQPKSAIPAKTKVEENKPKQVTIENEPISYDPDMINKRPGPPKSFAYLSQPYQCNYETDTIDTASRMVWKALKPDVLFTYTDPDLKPYFRGKDLMTCLGRISKIGSYVQLTIEFQIASSHSQNNFGSLEEGSLLRFKLMNDEYISLFNLKTNTGHVDPYTGYTIFSGQYALGKQEISKLGSMELDKMRVLWSTGFEDYDVYHVDFLIHQLNCVMSK
ncbi:MAG: hypothetical protein SH808_00255 [Saprospiraceae bacterium]|nr:hypothetical protein [Saprospiraceae bacterium]